MTTWILTTGNSDIMLNNQDEWLYLCTPIYEQLEYLIFEPIKQEEVDLWSVPARVLGMAYGQQSEDYYKQLHFPLLDNFCNYLTGHKIIPDKIVFLMSDQSDLFQERFSLKCPYWKDTCTLEPILRYYFNQKFPKAKLIPIILKPEEPRKGLDHWDSTLKLVQNVVYNLDTDRAIYVSHQAGTPAISSALQFVSLARFGKAVKFLVSNEYEQNSVEMIESSKYLRGILIEQSKGLVDTAPGAAKNLVEKLDDIDDSVMNQLDNLVNFFNLNRTVNDAEDEFSIECATRRIIDVLDLIGIFFHQENYLQGITLLAAAQETFMKVAILQKVQDLTVTIPGQSWKGKEVMSWTIGGLFLSSHLRNLTIENKKDCLAQLRFPVKNYTLESDKDFSLTNRNYAMLPWLKGLESRFQPWKLLEWSCAKVRERNDDLRNQLMHNLRGVEKQEVIEYLLGYKSVNTDDVMEAYNNQVKQPFLAAIELFDLPYQREKLRKQLDTVKSYLR